MGLFVAVFFYFGYKAYRIASLQTVKAKRGEIVSSVYASGKTKAEKEANLSFGSTGKIVYLPVKKNQEVKRGQIVATVDSSDLQTIKEIELQDYLKTRLDYDQIQNDTYKDRAETDIIRRAKEKAQFDLNKGVLNVNLAERAIRDSSLYSPFDGVVTAVNGEINEWISVFSLAPLITIIDPDSVYFEAELDEEDIGKITTGRDAIVTLDAYPERQFPGKIVEIEKKTVVKDNGDTVLPVKIIFNPGEDYPLVGLNGDVQFVLEKKENVLILPKRAIRKKNNSTTVFVKDNFGLNTVQVGTGIADAKNIQIIKGLKETDQVILSPDLE